jgi:hypothetical protein
VTAIGSGSAIGSVTATASEVTGAFRLVAMPATTPATATA